MAKAIWLLFKCLDQDKAPEGFRLDSAAQPMCPWPRHAACVGSSWHSQQRWGCWTKAVTLHQERWGHLAIPEDIFDCHNWWEVGVSGIHEAEARDAVKHLTMHRSVPHSHSSNPKHPYCWGWDTYTRVLTYGLWVLSHLYHLLPSLCFPWSRQPPLCSKMYDPFLPL